MPLLGRAAMLLNFDIAAEAVSEHDDWHTHEHLPERLSIPGFLCGTRWVAQRGGPRYFVLYEVERLETLASPAYLERLEHPSEWTRRMMPHYRGMTRGLCTVACSHGLGVGGHGLLIRFSPAAAAEAALDRWLAEELLPRLPLRPGLTGAHLFRGGLTAQMTAEQRIRGADGGVDRAVLVTGYAAEALEALERGELGRAEFERRGAGGAVATIYQAACTLTNREVVAAHRA